MKKFIYKVCYEKEWLKIRNKNNFSGSKKDISDGYIHFSNKNQIKSTLNKYFSKKEKLVLLKVSTAKLKKIFWEKSTGGDYYPHLYSKLDLKNIKSIYKILIVKNNQIKFIKR